MQPTTSLERITARPAAPAPDNLSQTTAIEQSRAVAEVQAAVVVAQQRPRDEDRALAAVRRACAQKSLADRAFFNFPRGGEPVTGPTVHLARELARCWGNIAYNIGELARDDAAGMSEMQAFAWDLETNTRAAVTFLVPHAKTKKDRGGRMVRSPIVDLRDIYENNANMGARRLREMIFAVLPVWLREEAEELCRATLAGEHTNLGESRARALSTFGKANVTQSMLERRVGKPADRWTAEDVAGLGVLWQSLTRKEITRDEAFGDTTETPADVLGEDWPQVAQPGGDKP